MRWSFNNPFASAIGWTCLMVWYCDRRVVERIVDKEYGGSYSAAGGTFILNFIAGVGAITMIGIVIWLIVTLIMK